MLRPCSVLDIPYRSRHIEPQHSYYPHSAGDDTRAPSEEGHKSKDHSKMGTRCQAPKSREFSTVFPERQIQSRNVDESPRGRWRETNSELEGPGGTQLCSQGEAAWASGRGWEGPDCPTPDPRSPVPLPSPYKGDTRGRPSVPRPPLLCHPHLQAAQGALAGMLPCFLLHSLEEALHLHYPIPSPTPTSRSSF